MIRAVTPADAGALARFFAANDVPEVTAKFSPFPLTAATAEAICVHGLPDRYFVEEADGVILGLAMLRGWKDGYAIPSFGLLVDRAAGGKGIGSALTAHAIAVARELQAPSVRLTVEPGNTGAVRIYTRAGFRPTGEETHGRQVMLLPIS